MSYRYYRRADRILDIETLLLVGNTNNRRNSIFQQIYSFVEIEWQTSIEDISSYKPCQPVSGHLGRLAVHPFEFDDHWLVEQWHFRDCHRQTLQKWLRNYRVWIDQILKLISYGKVYIGNEEMNLSSRFQIELTRCILNTFGIYV